MSAVCLQAVRLPGGCFVSSSVRSPSLPPKVDFKNFHEQRFRVSWVHINFWLDIMWQEKKMSLEGSTKHFPLYDAQQMESLWKIFVVKNHRTESNVSTAEKASPATRRPGVSGVTTMVEIKSNPSRPWECCNPSFREGCFSTVAPHFSELWEGVPWFLGLRFFCIASGLAGGILQESSGAPWNPQEVLPRAEALLSNQQMSAAHLLLVPGRGRESPPRRKPGVDTSCF